VLGGSKARARTRQAAAPAACLSDGDRARPTVQRAIPGAERRSRRRNHRLVLDLARRAPADIALVRARGARLGAGMLDTAGTTWTAAAVQAFSAGFAAAPAPKA
jgi:hypothetical protein